MFQGFSDDTFEFLMALSFNNNREFFHANHDWYVKGLRKPALELAGEPVYEGGRYWIPVYYNGKIYWVADYCVDLVVGAGDAPANKTMIAANNNSGSSWTGSSSASNEKEEEPVLKLVIVGNNADTEAVIKSFQDAALKGDALSALSEAVRAKIPATSSSPSFSSSIRSFISRKSLSFRDSVSSMAIRL